MTPQGTPVSGTLTFSSSNTTTPFVMLLAGTTSVVTLGTSEKIYITSVVGSTNDTAPNFITIDDGAAGQSLVLGYCSTTAQFTPVFLPGTVKSRPGNALRATLSGQTAAKATVIQFFGYISRS